MCPLAAFIYTVILVIVVIWMFGFLHSPRNMGCRRGRFDSVDIFDPSQEGYGVYNLQDIEPVLLHKMEPRIIKDAPSAKSAVAALQAKK